MLLSAAPVLQKDLDSAAGALTAMPKTPESNLNRLRPNITTTVQAQAAPAVQPTAPSRVLTPVFVCGNPCVMPGKSTAAVSTPPPASDASQLSWKSSNRLPPPSAGCDPGVAGSEVPASSAPPAPASASSANAISTQNGKSTGVKESNPTKETEKIIEAGAVVESQPSEFEILTANYEFLSPEKNSIPKSDDIESSQFINRSLLLPFRKAWWSGIKPRTCERTCRHRSKLCNAIQMCNDCTGYYCKWLGELLNLPVLKASGRVDSIVFRDDPLAKLYWDSISKVLCCPKTNVKCMLCVRRYQLFTHFLPGNLQFRRLVYKSVMHLNQEGFTVDMGLIRKVTRYHLESITNNLKLQLPPEYQGHCLSYDRLVGKKGPTSKKTKAGDLKVEDANMLWQTDSPSKEAETPESESISSNLRSGVKRRKAMVAPTEESKTLFVKEDTTQQPEAPSSPSETTKLQYLWNILEKSTLGDQTPIDHTPPAFDLSLNTNNEEDRGYSPEVASLPPPASLIQYEPNHTVKSSPLLTQPTARLETRHELLQKVAAAFLKRVEEMDRPERRSIDPQLQQSLQSVAVVTERDHGEQLMEENRLASSGVRGVFWDPSKESWCVLSPMLVNKGGPFSGTRRQIQCFTISPSRPPESAKWLAVYERLRGDPRELDFLTPDLRNELSTWLRNNMSSVALQRN